MIVTFNRNLQTTQISCYSPTNIIEEIEVERLFEDLSTLTRQIPKHNILIIEGYCNDHLFQME